jgi:predicted nucleotide-binding protein
MLASKMGIEIYKFVKDDNELRELREIRSKSLLGNQIRETLPRVKRIEARKKNNKVFIVHGRDTKPAKELKDMLIDFGLKPIILHEQASGSRTVIEKLEKYSSVGYAFVILTPEDAGYLQKDAERFFATKKRKHPVLSDIPNFMDEVFSGFVFDNFKEFFSCSVVKERARQNVILELGYFMALLKRKNVCCLYKGKLEYPSDIRGIVVVPFKRSVKEVRSTVITELRGARFQLILGKSKKTTYKSLAPASRVASLPLPNEPQKPNDALKRKKRLKKS